MRLMRTSEITKRPVVTMAGEDVAQVKDIVYAAGGGRIGGFTLAGRGLFSGPLKEALSWEAVSALGADAVIAVSKGMRGDILSCYPAIDPDRVRVIYNGIDADEYRPDPGTDVLERYGIDPRRP